nr:hypothetical protein Iba_chr01aCG14000 [Ipomoea batatas]GMC54723.1 hypothetical protein Iba_chr01eCG0630 [Ipomoea batatas]
MPLMTSTPLSLQWSWLVPNLETYRSAILWTCRQTLFQCPYFLNQYREGFLWKGRSITSLI